MHASSGSSQAALATKVVIQSINTPMRDMELGDEAVNAVLMVPLYFLENIVVVNHRQ